MTHTVRLFILLFIALLPLGGCGGSGSDSSPATGYSDLLQTFSTRQGITRQADTTVITTAADAVSQTFSDTLGAVGDRSRFDSLLRSALVTFDEAYRLATFLPDPTHARAIADDLLLDSLILAADQAGIARDRLELALLAAGAELESALDPQLVSTSMELFRTTWIGLSLNLHQRIQLLNIPEALADLDSPTAMTAALLQTVATLNNSLLNELDTLETVLHDNTVLQDSAQLIVEQFNLYALNDLTMANLGLQLNLGVDAAAVDVLITSLQSVPAMVNVTLQDLISNNLIATDAGGEALLPLMRYLVFDWPDPAALLGYQQITGLGNELLQLGGTLPPLPDYSLIADPYLSLFRFAYDTDLANLISAAEWNLAGTELLPPNLAELYDLRLGQSLHQEALLAGLTGVSDAVGRAFATLLLVPR